MHCEFTYTTNAFQDESWDLSNSKGYEHSFILGGVIFLLQLNSYKLSLLSKKRIKYINKITITELSLINLSLFFNKVNFALGTRI